jgi:hypothetical protein
MRELSQSVHQSWENIGDVVEGTLLKVETTTGKLKGKIARIQTDEGVVTVSAPTLLAQMLEDHWGEVGGKFVRITYTAKDKPKAAGQDGMKRFKVEVEDGEGGE